MKISHYVSVKLVIIAIACSFAAIIPIQAQEAKANSASARSGDNARLVVTRAANFGTFEFVNLFVDGVQVAQRIPAASSGGAARRCFRRAISETAAGASEGRHAGRANGHAKGR